MSTIVLGQVQPSVSGVIETYFLSNNQLRGTKQTTTWAELHGRATKNWSATWSGWDGGSFTGYDESYVRYESNQLSARVGRLRTSFGFSDWSELFYTGINHTPLIREMNLVGNTALDRDDSGIEGTFNAGPLQVQASLVDTQLNRIQIGPNRVDHGTLTLQYGLGDLILGAELLAQNDFSQKIYGLNARYTIPHWIFKGEYFAGVGPQSCTGGYIDANYRIPSKLRTEFITRLEEIRAPGSDNPTVLTTFGMRQIFNKNFTASLNYGWGNELNHSFYATAASVAGWSLRGMFQVQF